MCEYRFILWVSSSLFLFSERLKQPPRSSNKHPEIPAVLMDFSSYVSNPGFQELVKSTRE